MDELMDKVEKVLLNADVLPHYESLEAKLEKGYQSCKRGDCVEAFSFFDEMEKQFVTRYDDE